MARSDDTVTLQELEAAVKKMAWVIENFGDTYWPIFDRLDRELQQRRARAARLTKYKDDAPERVFKTAAEPANDQSDKIYSRNSSETG